MTRLARILTLLTLSLWLGLFTTAVHAQDATRQTYTWSKPAQTVTFNSITNNPAFGDERNFLRVRSYQSNVYADNLKVSDGEELVLVIYYDNNAASNYKLKSKNTRVKINVPSVSAKSLSVYGSVLSDNAKPAVVTDATSLSADDAFSLKYEPGSAQIWNNFMRGAKISDTVTKEGALIGAEKLDGSIAGGAKYSGYVSVKATVKFAKTSASSGSIGVVNGVPNTGPGDVVALFGGASALGAIGHRLNTARRRR